MDHADVPLTRREVVLGSAGAVLLALVTTWPLAWRAGEVLPGDLGDPSLQSWQLAWSGRAWLPGEPALLDSNGWYPLADSLAFSDPTIGYAPLATGVTSVSDAVLRYAIAYVLALALAWLGPYLLARELRIRPVAAALSATAVAYAPWRLAHDGHLNVLSTGPIALTLFLLVRGYRREQPGVVLAGWLVAAWQLTLSLGLGVPFAYGLGVLAVIVVASWWRAGRPMPSRPVLASTAAGVAAFGGVALWRGLPYLRIAEAHPAAPRTVGHLSVYSPPLRGLLAAPPDSTIWGDVTAPLRDGMAWDPEQTLFPGALVVVLAAVGVVIGRASRRLRIGLLTAAVVATVLALGVTVSGGRWTYLPLFDHLLGWRGLRTPGRLIVLTSLAVGLLAGLGTDAVRDRLDGVGRPRIGLALAAIALVGVFVEGVGTTPLSEVPPVPAAVGAAPAPQLHLPSGEITDARYLLWSVGAGYPALVNGTGSFVPDVLAAVRERTHAFPDRASVALLTELGVRSVVWHPSAIGTPWERAPHRDATGLGVRVHRHDDVVVFELHDG